MSLPRTRWRVPRSCKLFLFSDLQQIIVVPALLLIQRVLDMCQGNRLRAAQILGIGRTSLYRYLKRDGLEAGEKPGAGVTSFATTCLDSTLSKSLAKFLVAYRRFLAAIRISRPSSMRLPVSLHLVLSPN